MIPERWSIWWVCLVLIGIVVLNASGNIKSFSSPALPFKENYLTFLIGPLFGWPLFRHGSTLSSRGIRSNDWKTERRGWWIMFAGAFGILTCLLFFAAFFLAQLFLALST